ncbi:sulfotransferase family protein [Alkalibacillus sp. S2W]|uniref:sulfotransferase family protein n=1 Tax=Alkalibacillus sp. S2W TaxID=3386553 RepID=UPI00398D09A3
MEKANLFIIGASKCGTTSLYEILNEHPEICMSNLKETGYFAKTSDIRKNINYKAFYQHYNNEKVIGEVSPIYSELNVVPWVPRDLYNYNPDAQIIYIIRNPIKRMESVWKQTMSTGHWRERVYEQKFGVDINKMPLDFKKAIYNYPPFLEASKYWKQIQGYRKFFDDNQIKVVLFEDFVNKPDEVIYDLYNFMGVEQVNVNKSNLHYNPSQGKNMLNPKYKKILRLIHFVNTRLKTPYKLKKIIKSKISTSIPKETIEGELKKDVLDILDEDVKMILSYANKNVDYWKF